MDFIAFLEKLNENVMDFGLDRIKKVLDLYLTKTYQKIKIIHIAGTNGKGSTSNLLSNILENNCKDVQKVGVFTSPHIHYINERIKINNQNISDKNLEKYISKLKIFLDSISIKLTYFEFLTVVAIKYFIDESVDIAVFECGLGGRLDATNVFENPLLTIITNIDLEHQEFLGDTTEKILIEKLGICRENVPLITGVEQENLRNFLINREVNNQNLFLINRDFFVKRNTDKSFKFYDKNYFVLDKIELKIKGNHQYKNLALVLQAINLLSKIYNYKFEDNEKILETVNNFKLEGRLEFLKFDDLNNLLGTNLIFDVGHNLAGIRTCVEYLKEIRDNYEKVAIVFGILKDKDFKNSLKIIVDVADFVYLTEPKSERALDMDIILKYAKEINLLEKIKLSTKNIEEIKNDIKNVFGKNDLICVVGSFYLIKNFRH